MKKVIAFTAVLSLLAVSGTAFAANDIVITNQNSASVQNMVAATASTGGNSAYGSQASNLLRGGNISDANFDNHAGNGGNTVNGGTGGMVKTGNATAIADVSNTLNESSVDVHANPWAVGTISVYNNNTVALGNGVAAIALTGDNSASGSKAKNMLKGGNIHDANSSNKAGNGSNQVHGGTGGQVTTGDVGSQSSVVNVLNKTMTRIVR